MTPGARPRIEPGSRREVGVAISLFSTLAGLASRTQPPNLFRTLGRNRKLFRGWLRFAGRLMPGGSLPRRDTELVILRVASLRDCTYEFDHHVHLGKRAGITASDVARVVEGPDAHGWSERERRLLAAVDALHHDRDLSDDAWADLRLHLDEAEAIELLLLAGHYEMLATTIAALRIQPDLPSGWRRGR